MKRLEDYIITCEKYHFPEDTAVHNISLFSDADYTLSDTLDIKQFLISSGVISHAHESVDEIRNQLALLCASLDFEISGITQNFKAMSFFEVGSANSVYYKWLVKCFHIPTRQYIFEGILHNHSISERFERTKNSNIIKFPADALDKEFSDYYKNKSLPSYNTLSGWQSMPWTVGFGWHDIIYRYFAITFQRLLEELFISRLITSVDMDEYLQSLFVSNYPCLTHVDNSFTNFNKFQYDNLLYENDYNFINHSSERFNASKSDFFVPASALNSQGIPADAVFSSLHLLLTNQQVTHLGKLYNLKIKYALTTESGLTEFFSDPMTTVYYGDYNILLQNSLGLFSKTKIPFNLGSINWDGTSNIIIRFSYNLTANFIQRPVTKGRFSGDALVGWNAIYSGGQYTHGEDLTGGAASYGPHFLLEMDPSTTPFKRITNNHLFLKSGYQIAYWNNENKIDYLNYLCDSIGAVWTIHSGKLIVKNRSRLDNPIHNVDIQKIKSFEIASNSIKDKFEQIVIPDGSITSGHPTGFGEPHSSARAMIISDNPIEYDGRPWGEMMSDRRLTPVTNRRFQRIDELSDNHCRHCITTFVRDGEGDWTWGAEFYSKSKQQMLQVSAGDAKGILFGYNQDDLYQFVTFPGDPAMSMDENEITYSGNYGSAFFSLEYVDPDYDYLNNYEDLCSKSIFRKNFEPHLFDRAIIRGTIELNYEITSPHTDLFISGYSPHFLNGLWKILKLDTDIFNKKSTIEIYKPLNSLKP